MRTYFILWHWCRYTAATPRVFLHSNPLTKNLNILEFCVPKLNLWHHSKINRHHRNVCTHNGLLGTEKIFQKIELLVSMGRLTLNLVNPAQIKCKKRKKCLELDEIWTRVNLYLVQNEQLWLRELTNNLNFLQKGYKSLPFTYPMSKRLKSSL